MDAGAEQLQGIFSSERNNLCTCKWKPKPFREQRHRAGGEPQPTPLKEQRNTEGGKIPNTGVQDKKHPRSAEAGLASLPQSDQLIKRQLLSFPALEFCQNQGGKIPICLDTCFQRSWKQLNSSFDPRFPSDRLTSVTESESPDKLLNV